MIEDQLPRFDFNVIEGNVSLQKSSNIKMTLENNVLLPYQ